MIAPKSAIQANVEAMALDDSIAPRPRVSIVIAAYGRREQTLACLRSIFAQDLAVAAPFAVELVVVDDGSPDGTAESVEQLFAHAPFSARLLRNEKNLGANRSRNRGVRLARGELVAFLDSDCVADSSWLRALIAPFVDPTIGAVSGLVEDTPATNVWELAFHGTHRLPRRGDVSRLVIGNLCVRRELLLAHELDETRPTRIDPATGRPDLTVSGRSDEEGLNLALRAAGWRIVAEPFARAIHHHPYTRRALFRQAWFGGRSAAELVWKYRLGPRKDLGPIIAAHASLACSAIFAMFHVATPAFVLLVFGLFFALLAVFAISYNEFRNKGKSFLELLRAAPALFVYYEIRSAGFVFRRVELLLQRAPMQRTSVDDLARALPKPRTPPGHSDIAHEALR